MNIKKQLAKMYSMDILGAFNLTDSIWLVLLVSRGFSLWEAGLAEGIFHLVSFVGEIPSGMFADLYGRRRALCASWVVFACAGVLMLLSTDIVGVCLAFGLNALGYNLASGTREALVYDSLRQAGEEERYILVCSWQNVLWRGTRAVASLLAGVALLLGYRVCYLLHLVTCGVGFCVALTLTEAENGQPRGKEKLTLGRISRDFATQTTTSVTFLRETPTARAFMLGTAVTTGTVAMVGFFVQQQLYDVGAGGAATLGPLLFLLSLGGMAGARLAAWVGHKGSFPQLFALCGGLMSVGMLLCGASWAPFCVAGGFVMFLFDELLCTVTEARLNHLFPSEQRASLLSVFSMCISLSMIVLSPAVGTLCGWLGIGRAFGLLAAALACWLLYATRQLSKLT